MKNITIRLPDSIERWLRIKAAEDDLTVSDWICELLERTRRRERNYKIAMRSYLTGKPDNIDRPGEGGPAGEELHDGLGPEAA
ncbi:hypothetical protein [Candidatus Palauibacter sp.]|uniref:hypothetical protein n=1 Tax=Candidatus Palauibacter sp. TaxID=3101350 RepID=UPI003AF24BCA